MLTRHNQPPSPTHTCIEHLLLFSLLSAVYMYMCPSYLLEINSSLIPLFLSRFVLAITKCDLASPEGIKAVSDFASKQKKPPPVVEVCAHQSINVSAVVHLAAHYGNQKFGIPKPKVCACVLS